MARVFYHTRDGSIYGVHPGPHENNPKIRLPEGVAWIDVPEAPNVIPWPSVGGEPGSERTTRVQGGVLQAIPGSVPTKRARLDQMLRSHNLTLADLRAELASGNGAASASGKP